MLRPIYLNKIRSAFKVHSVVALLGPRQCGKTTLAAMYSEQLSDVHHFDLEDPRDLARLEAPMLALEELQGLIIIDEIQKRPELFPVLRVLVDKPNNKQKYLILGSASRDLIQQSSETLAGRIAYIELQPFSLQEVEDSNRLWLRGGFPRSYLADDISASNEWRRHYITTFLERDIPSLGINIPPAMLRRFWLMLAHYHGNIFNASEIGRSLGISHTAVRNYLSILVGVFMIRELSPWYENLKKRQVKAPKIYFKDSGLLNTLVGINTMDDLQTHPKLGAFWEGYALEEVVRYHQAEPEESYFWATHAGAELDLFIIKNGKRLGFEFKYTDSPKLTKSMQAALIDLSLDQLTVIFPGQGNFPLAAKVRAIGLASYISLQR
jgi:predicted AAA+ superfamily ATPase